MGKQIMTDFQLVTLMHTANILLTMPIIFIQVETVQQVKKPLPIIGKTVATR